MYKNKEGKSSYPHQKTIVTTSITRSLNFNNSSLIRINNANDIINNNVTEETNVVEGNFKGGTQPSSEKRRLEQRQKQIEYGKNTIGYKVYTKVIKKENRKKTDPWTPDKYTKCSKRCWDGMVRTWRRQLHSWDPPEATLNSNDSNSTLQMEINNNEMNNTYMYNSINPMMYSNVNNNELYQNTINTIDKRLSDELSTLYSAPLPPHQNNTIINNGMNIYPSSSSSVINPSSSSTLNPNIIKKNIQQKYSKNTVLSCIVKQ